MQREIFGLESITQRFFAWLLNINSMFPDGRIFQMLAGSAFKEECYIDFYMKKVVPFNNKNANF